jgi:hypothetical protein
MSVVTAPAIVIDGTKPIVDQFVCDECGDKAAFVDIHTPIEPPGAFRRYNALPEPRRIVALCFYHAHQRGLL